MKTIVVLVGLALSLPVWSATISVTEGSDGSTTDLFNGASVISSQNVASGFSPEDAFGAIAPVSLEPGNVIGVDNSILRIEFNPGEVTINRLVVNLNQDGASSNRSADLIQMFADTGSGWFSVFSFAPADNYQTTYGTEAIAVTVDLDASITSDTWAIEVTGGAATLGARLNEVDGFNVVPEPATAGLLAGAGLIITAYRRFFSKV